MKTNGAKSRIVAGLSALSLLLLIGCSSNQSQGEKSATGGAGEYNRLNA